MRYLLPASAVAILAVAVAVFKFSRSGYESPDYEVELEDGGPDNRRTADYGRPFTPPFLRRNEILIRLSE